MKETPQFASNIYPQNLRPLACGTAALSRLACGLSVEPPPSVPRLLPTFGRVDDLTYWQEKLRQAEADLDAARMRSAVDEAASRYQRAKAELKAREQASKRTRARAPKVAAPRVWGR